MKLCDTRSSDVCLEPELNSAPTKEHYKKKSNGLRRLKGPDVGTEEWGNLSDDLGNGSDDSEEEYSSSDESVEGTYVLTFCVCRVYLHTAIPCLQSTSLSKSQLKMTYSKMSA